MNAPADNRAFHKDVLGRTIAADAPRARQREIYLSYAKPSRWDALAMPLSQLRQFLVTFLVGLAGVGTGVPLAYILPQEYWLFSWVVGITAAIEVFWYVEFRRPQLREAALRQEALKLAGSPSGALLFTNGMTGSFNPKGAILIGTGSAMGFDPRQQLVRSVFVDGIKQRIWFDWVYGLDECGELAIVELPRRGIFNAMRRLLGGRLRTEMTMVALDLNGMQHRIARISPEYLDRARHLVREMNFHRPKSDTIAT